MNKEINIDLRRCFRAILKKWWLMVIVGVICYCIAYLITNHNIRENEYTAETTVYSINGNDYSSLSIYSDIITSFKVCEKAASSLNMTNMSTNKIQKMVSVNNYSTTLVLGIRATSTDKNLSIKVANAVADAFIGEVNDIKADKSVRLLDEATTSKLSYNKQIEQLKLRLAAVFAGIFLMCVWIIIREIFTKKIFNLSDMGMEGEIIIGIVPSFDKKMKGDIK